MTSTLLRAAPPPRQHQDGWWHQAACLPPANPDWWIPPANRFITEGNRHALRICAACPVRRPCLDEAIRLQEVGVIRGGHRMPSGPQGWHDKMPNHIKKLLRGGT